MLSLAALTAAAQLDDDAPSGYVASYSEGEHTVQSELFYLPPAHSVEKRLREMASEEMKKARQDAAEHAKMALMDDRTYKNYAGKATEDGILKCPRCKSMKTEYVEVQTRSADEPTTKKCTCNNCDYRWKFC